jgi:circadian clock protein KaiC
VRAVSDKTIQRLATGVEGLDEILTGGVFRGGIYIVQGAPGAGKTILANQLCFAHAAAGGKALYVTLLSENHARLLGHMQTLSFFDASAIPDRVVYLSAFRILEENGLKGLVESLRREIMQQKATMLVLDGLVSAEESAGSPRELKKFVHELQTQAAITDCTTFLLTSAYMERQMVSAEHTMVDGIFELQSRLYGRRAEREIQVHKFRGSEMLSGVHSFRITGAGMTVYPRIESLYSRPSLPEKADGPFMSIGVPGIDAMLGGGVTRHSNTLVLGPAGTGKTTLGLHFLGANPAARGVFFSFSEPPPALQGKADMLGLPVADLLRDGTVQTLWQPVTEALLDEVCARLLRAVREHKADRLFLDGADGLGKLTAEQGRISAVLTAMSNELRSLSITTLSTAETDLAGVVPGQPLAGLSVRDLSPIAENILVLRHATVLSQTHRLMTVVKAREGKTDMRFRRYEIGSGGIDLDPDSTRAEDLLIRIASRREGGGPAASPPLADPLGRGD